MVSPAHADAAVAEVYEAYPDEVRPALLALRELIFEAAANERVGKVSESLKWGEPSYAVEGGTAVRIGWKKSTPERYALHVHCGTRLIETFREVFGNRLVLQGNRAIVFRLGDDIPVNMVKTCIGVALTYHARKHRPLLGL